MRTLIINMLAAALLLFGASSASAFSINHTTTYDGFSELEVSDTVTVNVFLDTEGFGVNSGDPVNTPGMTLISMGIVFQDSLTFDDSGPGASYSNPGAGPYAYLNGSYPTYYGQMSLYALYVNGMYPATGTFSGQYGARYMVPQQYPKWQNWPTPPGDLGGTETPMCPSPGTCGQVNLNWVPNPASNDFSQQLPVSSNTWLGSIVLHVDSLGPASVQVGPFINLSCCALITGDGADHKATTTIDAPTTINLPEPTIALLLGFGLLGLGLAGRRQD
jgi:hypothetical protein